MSAIAVYRGDTLLCRREAPGEVQLCYEGQYLPGDQIFFQSDTSRAVVRVDGALAPARVYLPKGSFSYRLPLEGDNPDVYPPFAFQGKKHLLELKPDTDEEYRNLALNPVDQRGETDAFPHVFANVETRNESQFAARNVIDGSHIAYRHGYWPFQSWGIGARADAEITLDFGREVEIHRMALYLRADFPHDAWWVQGRATLSDGYETTFPLDKLDGPQTVDLGPHRARWVKLDRLIKCDVSSAYPSLRQWEIYGKDLKAE